MSIDTDANALFASLIAGLDITLPVVSLSDPLLQLPTQLSDAMYQTIHGPDITDLTTRTVGGAGVFDALMASNSAHLKAEFDKGRITGAEYTKAYIETTQIAMQMAVQFALGKNQAFWQAQQAQVAAISARVQLETIKVELAKTRIEAETSAAQYAQAKIQLALESVQYTTAQYNLDNMLPAQLAQVNAAVAASQYNVSTVLPAQVALTGAQTSLTTAQQVVATRQAVLLSEQLEAQRAQTMDTRTDGQMVVGSVGKQKELYAQQVVSYKRDAEVKAAKLFTDSWITQKTVDDALTAPTGFTNASIDTILTALKTNNGLT